MVDRSTSNALEEFVGVVEDVVLEKNTFADNDSDQFHIIMDPEDVDIQGKTGKLHEWVRLSPKTTDTTVPEGSVVERYLSQIELVVTEAKKAKTLKEAFDMMKGKKFQFKRVALGRAFEGKPARKLWVPTAKV